MRTNTLTASHLPAASVGAIRPRRRAEVRDPYDGLRPWSAITHGAGAVLAALDAGEIPASRHESYLALYEAAQKIPDWAREGRKGGKE